MSSSNNSNNENPIQSIKEMTAKATSSLPSLSLKTIVKTTVSKTNTMLSTLEHTKYTMDQNIHGFFSSRIRPLMTQMSHYGKRCIVLYQKREYYGPQIVSGSAAAVSSIVYLRRGRLPAIVSGGVTGVGVYTGIYGLPKFV